MTTLVCPNPLPVRACVNQRASLAVYLAHDAVNRACAYVVLRV